MHGLAVEWVINIAHVFEIPLHGAFLYMSTSFSILLFNI